MNALARTWTGAVLLLLVGEGAPASAQVWPGPGQDLEVLYSRILEQPSNVEIGIEYARLAAARGDYEAAISVYERLLLFAPERSDLKYEIGVLYFLLESYAAARPYFEAALSGDLRSKAQSYLTEIDRLLSPNRWTAYVHLGLRHQSNATAGPSSLGRVGGQDINLASTFTKRPDWNAFIQASAHYEHDFGNERGDTFEATLVGYYSKQFEVSRVDLGAAELQAGPRFALLPEYINGVSTKIYGIVNGYTLGDHPYLWTNGAGVSLRRKVNPALVLETAFEYRNRKFFDSANYPTAAQQSGDLFTYFLAGSGLVSGPMRWIARAGYDWSQANFGYWSYERPFIDVGIPTTFSVDWGDGDRALIVTPYGGASWINYDIPNPMIDPNVTRRDREWHVGSTFDVELVAQAGLRLNLYYQRYSSNIVNFNFNNFAVSIGPAFRF